MGYSGYIIQKITFLQFEGYSRTLEESYDWVRAKLKHSQIY